MTRDELQRWVERALDRTIEGRDFRGMIRLMCPRDESEKGNPWVFDRRQVAVVKSFTYLLRAYEDESS